MIDGGDRDDHGYATSGPDNLLGTADDVNWQGWLFIEQMIEFAINGNLNHAPKDILVVGASSTALSAIQSAAVVQGLSTTVRTGAALSSENLNDYKVLYVPSDLNTGGGVSSSDLSILKQRKIDIQNFINNGGSAVALTEEATPEPYAWLELPLLFVIADAGNGMQPLHKTQAAINAGFTISDAELSNGVPYHNTFIGPPDFNGLVPFVRDASDRIITLGFSSLLR